MDRSRCEQEAAEEFHRRQTTAATLCGHPRFAPLVETGSLDGVAYFAMGDPPGKPLPEYLAQPHTLPSNISSWTIRAWMSDLASLLDFAHQRGIVIGNLWPGSVWIGSDGSAYLSDPGHHGTTRWTAETTDRATSAGESHLSYMAPEQLTSGSVTPRADIYSLGVILFVLQGGELPRRQYSDAAAIGRYLPLPPLASSADPVLGNICRLATSISAKQRFRSAQMFRTELLLSPQERAFELERLSKGARRTMVRGVAAPSPAARAPSHPILRWLSGWIQ